MSTDIESVAIIGMSGRFPHASNLDDFWRNLREGHEAVEFFKAEETEWLPIERKPDARDRNFVRVRAMPERPEWFDAAFFQFNPREAAIMDPQQRVFLECAWEALEHAGCDARTFPGSIGVFAGSGFNTYLINNLLTNGMLLSDFGLFPALTLNDKDYLATRVAYKLDLHGPCINVQTACSTSLVAICMACQNLLSYQCDVALAGGVSIPFPANRGIQHTDGAIGSADGHCRAFDANATGTVPGGGAGVVVLKRLSEAIGNGDRICAVIKGWALNNDGHSKIGFTAPGIDGQAECVAMAQAMASVDPATITYIEAHGTGTPLGDPIEIAALKKAFGPTQGRSAHCAVGSLKTNIGHLDTAAGVAGLIKTALALQHREIPPTLHFQKPNPALELEGSPFFINDRLLAWPPGTTPRRAGVSSFGIGGTNAHVVLEEAPSQEKPGTSRSSHLLVLSARTPTALDAATENLARHLQRHLDINLADVAYTLQTGRRCFEYRRACVVTDVKDAITVLQSGPSGRITEAGPQDQTGKVVFMFSGQGTQTVNMARQLYEQEAVFREQVDLGCSLLQRQLGRDLRTILFTGDESRQGTPTREAELQVLLTQTRFAQPALFIIEYALVQLFRSWGISPAAMIGHSLGEYVAACVAGAFTFEEGLTLVTHRARYMQEQPPGAMLAVRMSESQLREVLGPDLAFAGANARNVNVVSGDTDVIAAFERKLLDMGVASRRLATSHAFHSAHMEPVMRPLADLFRRVSLRAPRIPWVSNLTGNWITAEQATSPDYWASQMRSTVRFADGVGAILRSGHRLLLEIGPGQTLTTLARHNPEALGSGAKILATMDSEPGTCGDLAAVLRALGAVWAAGAIPDWRGGFYANERRNIVELPTYPFERTRCWIEPGTTPPAIERGNTSETAHEGPAASSASDNRLPAQQPTPPTKPASTAEVVRGIIEELSGSPLNDSTDRTFNELGFDSLLVAQVATAVQRRFSLPVSLRLLQEDVRTPGQLAEYVTVHLPVPAAPPTAVLSVAHSESGTPPSEMMRSRPQPEGSEGHDVPMRSGSERLISEICSAVLGIEKVDVHDNFFALGGSSLQAMQVLSRVHEVLGVELTWEEWVAAPTVAGLAFKAELARSSNAVRATGKETPWQTSSSSAATPPVLHS